MQIKSHVIILKTTRVYKDVAIMLKIMKMGFYGLICKTLGFFLEIGMYGTFKS